MARAPWLAVLALAGCPAAEGYRNADLQVDILGALPEDATRVRTCVDGAGSRTEGAGPDRYAVPGLPTVRAAVVTVDVLAARTGTGPWEEDTGGDAVQVIARAGPVTVDAEVPWQETPLASFLADGQDAGADCPDCPGACEATGAFAGEEEESWLLAVRFRP
jgi:hypothetical protein